MKTLITFLLTLFFALPAYAANIADTLSEDENFSTLNTALESSDLGETLASGEDITLFAPNNDAFERLPEGFAEYLTGNTELLNELLNYHVATELLQAEDLARLTEIPTENGQVIAVKALENELVLNNAKVVETTEADNGLVHEVDRILFPPLLFDSEPADDTADDDTTDDTDDDTADDDTADDTGDGETPEEEEEA